MKYKINKQLILEDVFKVGNTAVNGALLGGLGAIAGTVIGQNADLADHAEYIDSAKEAIHDIRPLDSARHLNNALNIEDKLGFTDDKQEEFLKERLKGNAIHYGAIGAGAGALYGMGKQAK